MKIGIGEIFRVSRSAVPATLGYRNYLELTCGSHDKSADINKGIWAYKDVKLPGVSKRTPAILLHSNPFKEGSIVTPWMDVVEPDLGYAFFNGDNRKSGQDPADQLGNAILTRLQSHYADPHLRSDAPPVLLFTQVEVAGNRKGYRQFSGYGVPARYVLVSQHERGTNRYFTNLAVELCLFRLDSENEEFDWAWIDKRRDRTASTEAVRNAAPAAWRSWVENGEAALEKCRRRVARRRVISTTLQLDYSDAERHLLQELATCFENNPHAFEGLAALIAERVIGHGCRRAWVTRRSADGGVDFVSRVDVGSEFSRMAVVVLGQAKCVAPDSSVNGKDLARLVARLQRGWFGVFVTTGTFSTAAQMELHEDQYPVVLINGKRLAREVRTILTTEGITLVELLKRERQWYDGHLRALHPRRALDDAMFTPQLNLSTDSEKTVG